MSQSITKPFLKRGCQGQNVLDLQCALAAAGVYTGNFDGSFGAGTEVALLNFQKHKNLPVSGIVESVTEKALGLPGVEPAISPSMKGMAETVSRLFPGTPRSNIEVNLPPVLTALSEANLADKQMVLVALATICAEAASFLPISELPSAFNTSPGGKSFDLYDNRAALGNGSAPDGADFRGRGFVQLTGRANFLKFGRQIGLGDQLVINPLKAHESITAAKILAAFLKNREARMRAALQQNRLSDVRRLVNGGSNGLAQFTKAFYTGAQLLPDRIAA